MRTMHTMQLKRRIPPAPPPPRPPPPRQGTVDSLRPPQIVVSGQPYTIDKETELLDRGGHRIALSELVPGTPVELEVDDEGTLVAIRATLVR
jgi:hypothetical protein